MIAKFNSLFIGDGMKARAIRGTILSVAGFGGAQVIRLGSNLILTRILFPEAFGLMALVQVVLAGLQMFSDFAIGQSIIRSPRSNDPKFLHTAWTLQIGRGAILWVLACLLAAPMARFYGQEELTTMIIVLGATTLIAGFASVKISLVNRDLMLGRLTLIELSSQIIGTVLMIVLAYLTQSVWSLAFGAIAGAICTTLFSHLMLPGPKDRIGWDVAAFWEMFHFGKYIFVGTISGFFVQNGDRAVLGRFVSLEDLAVYTIALTLAAVPLTLNFHLINRIMLPLYRNRPPSESARNRRDIGKALLLIRLGLSLGVALMAIIAELLIDILYDDRYQLAGGLLVLISLSMIPRIIIGGYDVVLLAAGNSRHYTILLVGTAVLTTIALYFGIGTFGLLGAVFAPMIVAVVTYPALVYFIRPYDTWFPWMDLGLYLLVLPITAVALWNNPGAMALLSQLGGP